MIYDILYHIYDVDEFQIAWDYQGNDNWHSLNDI